MKYMELFTDLGQASAWQCLALSLSGLAKFSLSLSGLGILH